MDILWAPWRHAYVTRGEAAESCVFCTAPIGDGHRSLIVHQGTTAFVILNLYPYNNGHLLIAPRRHVASLAQLGEDERRELFGLTCVAEAVLAEAYRPEGINAGMNLGKPAGAGIADHLHMHLVPRWTGDTNYMTVVGQVRVLTEELTQTAERLRPIFARLAA